MKRLSVFLVFLGLVVFAVLPGVGNAVPINSLPGLTYSPNSDSTPYTPPTTDDVFLTAFGTVKIGFDPTLTVDTGGYLAGDTQAMGTYGLGVHLTPYFGGVSSYEVSFDTKFRTWDWAIYDTFQAVITSGNFLWAAGTVVPGGFSWGGLGGTPVDTLQTYDTPFSSRFTASVNPAGDYYLNLVLITTGDNSYPSWGSFTDVGVIASVAPVPEPATMLLLGSGLIGIGVFARKRFKK